MTINILYYNEGEDLDEWLPKLKVALPDANIRCWQEGDDAPADYALVWNPPEALLKDRKGLKAVFNLAAGVDDLLASDIVPKHIPLFRLEDAGMAIQLAEYAVYAVLRYFRRFDEYVLLQRRKLWANLTPNSRSEFTIGIMGLGVMGRSVVKMLKPFGFPIKGWSRSKKQIVGVECYFGNDALSIFLKSVRVLICLLPLTDATRGIIGGNVLNQLADEAYLINLGRGSQLNERDLLRALDSGKVRGATLDVATVEPLPQDHPFWMHPNIVITPHIAGLTFSDEVIAQVAPAIRQFERGEIPNGLVDRNLGY